MIIKIGIIAGEIWSHLDKKAVTKLSEIYSVLDHPNDLILMSIGWLARKGHVILEKEDSDFKVSLRPPKNNSSVVMQQSI